MVSLTRINKQILFGFLFFICFNPVLLSQQRQNFVIVIDPGHGGHDAGARGAHENEKDINLGVSLKFGEMIKAKHKDVKVIYTRTGDYFLKLWERADIANKNHANLFVSIHSNSAGNKSAYGSETYVMGISRMQENIEVSKRENSVILLEDDQERYQKFDPSDPEAVIAFEIMHSAYQEQSIRFAQLVENEFVKKGRSSRGVKQNIFHVLRENASPSVLVELGFVSNYDENAFLASEAGKQIMAEALLAAFDIYKAEWDNRNGIEEKTEEPEPEPEVALKDGIYKIQILTSKKKHAPSDKVFNGLTNIETIRVGNVFKYYYGSTDSPSQRDQLLETAIRKGFKDAFEVEFLNKKTMEGNQNYRILFLVSNDRYKDRHNKFGGLKNVVRLKEKNVHYYYYGSYRNYGDAEKNLEMVKGRGFKNAYLVVFDGGKPLK